jgi:hypothetical protein
VNALENELNEDIQVNLQQIISDEKARYSQSVIS